MSLRDPSSRSTITARSLQSLDATNGRFEWGYAPRRKRKHPQRLAIDDMVRPILKKWWEAAGSPLTGFVFPALRDGKHAKAGKGEEHNVSHASALRTDLRGAFGIDELKPQVVKQKNGRKMPGFHWVQVRDLMPREIELLGGAAYVLPVDFHSWRRAYCQALADAGVNAQQARALAGHSTEAAHERYLRSSDKVRVLPSGARPRVDLADLTVANQVSSGASKSAS